MKVYLVCFVDDPHNPMGIEAVFTTEDLAGQYAERLKTLHPYTDYEVVPYDLLSELPSDEMNRGDEL